MEVSSRRKACDTCFKKKIKCDTKKPICSNCELYKVKCTTTVIRRRAAPQKTNPVEPVPQQTAPPMENDSLEARLARIESKLNSLGNSSASLQVSPLGRQSAVVSPQVSPQRSWYENHDEPAVQAGSSDPADTLSLPPMHEMMPTIETYFSDFNSVIPLFHQGSFMKLLRNVVSGASSHRSRASWAVINAVLALGLSLRNAHISDDHQVVHEEFRGSDYFGNVQKVLDDLIMRDEDTLGLQAILALIIIYQSSPNAQPAAVLISVAVRLAHRLQLHTRLVQHRFSPEEARQRDNIFWICYFLDKDISIRTRTPSIQLDIDIDIDLPGTLQVDDQGELQTIDGLFKFNYFRSRVQLAHLQGQIYDNLYSVRSSRLTMNQRMELVKQLDTRVDEWRRSIPTPLQLEHMTQSLARVPALHMTILQHHYLLCLTFIHGLYSAESEWVKAIGLMGRAALENHDNNTDICMKHMQPPLPSAWARCATASRGSIQRFLSGPQSPCSLAMNTGAYFTGLVILLVNCQYFPTNESMEEDRMLAKDGVKLLAKFTRLRRDDKFDALMDVLYGLEKIADKLSLHFKMHPNDIPPAPIHAQMAETQRGTYNELGTNLAGNAQSSAAMPMWFDSISIDSHPWSLPGFDLFGNNALDNLSVNSIFQI
ncbi:fungal-specific transcription factor domain-containing protein [Xylariales sp. PMI_506]|nr:fungal-specific transcription factor domain-containing protein [Xylariales sp. PMI_506]